MKGENTKGRLGNEMWLALEGGRLKEEGDNLIARVLTCPKGPWRVYRLEQR